MAENEEKTEQKAEPDPSKIKSNSVVASDLGMRLPIGISGAKTFATKPWTMKEERALGKLRSQNRDAGLPQYVSMVLATMCTKMGPHDFNSMEHPQKMAVLSQMYLGDVFYAYVRLRIEAIGSVIKLAFTCPYCRKQHQFPADLETTEVLTLDTPQDGEWEYTMCTPITLRGKVAQKLIVGQVQWHALEQADGVTGGTGEAKSAMITGGVVALVTPEGERVDLRLDESDLDEMTKRDIEGLVARIDDNSTGPVMMIEDLCPNDRCPSRATGALVKVPIDWGFDAFFADSSL